MDDSASVIHKWKIRSETFPIGERTLVMGILNLTPDSFSDGGEFTAVAKALARAEEIMHEGACIIDIGGESTRPGAMAISVEEELARVLPVVGRLKREYNPAPVISVDTTKAAVAHAALDAGADVINDISGLRFEPELADAVANAGAGLVLMHSLGTPETLHSEPPVEDIMQAVRDDWRRGITEATRHGATTAQIALDPGIGFGKTQEQNLELLARLNELIVEFADFPILIGTSRKRFIGRLLDDAPVSERLHGTMATIAAAVFAGASIVRVHDVRAAVETARVADAIRLRSEF
jgi:dihydropteroate synthase